jgi:hypothetical protein
MVNIDLSLVSAYIGKKIHHSKAAGILNQN